MRSFLLVAAGAGVGAVLADMTSWPLGVEAGAAGVLALAAVGASRMQALHGRDRHAGAPGWDALAQEFARHRRYGRPITVVHLSLADPEGDAGRIATLATAMQSNLRTAEHAFVDGDGISFILPDTPKSAATLVLDRLVAKHGVAHLTDRLVSVSFPDDALTAAGMVEMVTAPRSAQRPVQRTAPRVSRDVAVASARNPRATSAG